LFISYNKIKGWFNDVCSNCKYNNKEVYYKVYNKFKEVFWILIFLLIEKIIIYSDYIIKVPVLYTFINI